MNNVVVIYNLNGMPLKNNRNLPIVAIHTPLKIVDLIKTPPSFTDEP